jgi:hypothetical protein
MLSGTERQAAGSIYGAMSYDIENKPTAFDTHRAIGHRRKPHRSQQAHAIRPPRPTLCCDAVDCRTHAPPGGKRVLASNKKKLIQISHLPRANGKTAQNNAVL